MVGSLLCVLIGYLCGSISTAVWYGMLVYGVDIRNHGSGNAGATNSLRVLGKQAGILVLVIDFLKGFLPILVVQRLGFDETTVLLSGFAAVLGHLLPVFSKFKGGKGIATSMGVIVGVFPLGALVCLIIFSLCVLLTKYVSLGSILGALAFPISVVMFSTYSTILLIFSICLALLLVFTHRKNIGKLLSGVESKLGQTENNFS